VVPHLARIARSSAIAVCAAIATTAIADGSADAAPPNREHESFTNSDSIDCSMFDEGWNFVDEVEIDRQYFYDHNGNVVRITEHWELTSTDVNSVTGLTINEHNHFLADADLLNMTVTVSGAINSAQRPAVGSVILQAGHKIWELDLTQDPPLGELLFNAGPNRAGHVDFCRALA
jgi:hypothetical protein